MIEDYRALAVFVAVTEAGSFSGAGRSLKLSTSVVSHHISKLEEKLGISLFFRSTRALSLTPEGTSMLEAARRMVAAGEEALDMVSTATDQLVGALRVAIPAFGENSDVHKALWSFAKQNPMVALSLHGSDRRVDLVREGFDLAIRLGSLSDSRLMSRRIGSFERVLVASPDYLASRPKIKSLEDLKSADFVSLSMISDTITLQKGKEQVGFEPESVRLEVDSVATAKSALLAGLGIQHLPRSEIERELADGTLIEVLPTWRPPVLGVYAVWPEIGHQKRLTRQLIDYLAAASKGSSVVSQYMT